LWRDQTQCKCNRMKQARHRLTVETHGQGFTDITGKVVDWVAAEAISRGLVTVWCGHTSASLVVQANTDPDVRADLEAFFRRLVPEAGHYSHAAEGPDDMPTHIRAALTLTQVSVPVEDGRRALGMWQAIYLFEHRANPRQRELVLHLIGE
jgi:secondary thiamine-phosphate synthase enzyme